MQEHILTDKPFQFSPSLLRKLAADRWSHWGNDSMGTVDFPIYDRILSIQKVVLRQVFDPAVMSRILNNTLKAEKDERPLTLAELFRGVSDCVWNPAAGAEPANASTSLIRRNLQREHIRELSNLVLGSRNRNAMLMFLLGGEFPRRRADARNLARMPARQQRARQAAERKARRRHAGTSGRMLCPHQPKVMTASMQLRMINSKNQL